MIYGYARISRPTQRIFRQIDNIKDFASSQGIEITDKEIFSEAYTGASTDRPEFKRLLKTVRPNDTIIFDSVSRMSRDADEGIKIYFDLYNKGISLIFLKERHIDTDFYDKAKTKTIDKTGNKIADIYIEATNEVIRVLAEEQIRLAFWQSEKEVTDLRVRTKDGIAAAKRRGKLVGGQTQVGMKKKSSKAEAVKPLILKYSKDFHGKNNDIEVIGIIKQKLSITLSRNSYYKYKKELAEEIRSQEEKDIDDILQSETI